MKILPVQQMLSYKGYVYQDKNKIQKEINKSPLRIRDSLKENIDIFSERIKRETPKDARFAIDFEEAEENSSVYDPRYYYGVIKISNSRGDAMENKFLFGRLGGSAKDAKSFLADNETIWKDGFQDIMQRILNGELYENGINSLENSAKFKKLSPEAKVLARYLFDRLNTNESEKVVMKKTNSVIGLTKALIGCPDEVIESVIDNINILISKLENETPKDKMYYVEVAGSNSSMQQLNVTVGEYCLSKENAIEGVPVYGKRHSVNRFLLTRRTPESGLPYCVTNSEQIYEEIFKPITDKILEIANH